MANFGEWLFFEEIREEIYGESLRRLHIHEALRRTFEFYNMAVSGQWDLILENSPYDDDDGPVELEDPFAGGDENAPEVKLPARELPSLGRGRKKKKKSDRSPHELRSRYDGWSPPKEDKEEEGETPDSEQPDDVILAAKTIQNYARLVRWAAMLDRRDMVAKVADIYRNELLPLVRQNESTQLRESEDDSDDEDWVLPWLKKDAQSPGPEASATPQPTQAPPPARSDSLATVIAKIAPLLEKLGYIEEGALNYGTDEEKTRMVMRAAENASRERGNDPPADNPDAQRLVKNPESRAQYAEFLMSEISEMLRATANRVYRQIRRLQGSEGGEKKYGAEMDEDEILNRGVEINMRQLQRRVVNKDGTAKEWNDDLNILKIRVDDEEEASRIINTIKSPISSPERALRDERRARDKTTGQRPGSRGVFTCSECGHTLSVSSRHVGTKMKCPKCQGEGTVQQVASAVSYDAGATAEDGTVTGMDVADPKGSTAIDAASADETSRDMMEAFREAMRELAQGDPSRATLTCLWLGLHGENPSDCTAPNKPPSHEAIKTVISGLLNVNLSDRNASKDAFEKIGINNFMPGATHGKFGEARWNFIKFIKQHAPRAFPTMPKGEIPAGWTPKYTERHNFTPEQAAWYRWMNTVIDTLSKNCLPFLARRMQEILADRQPDIRPKGWESPCSWSLQRFLRATFAQSIRAGTIVVTGDNPTTFTIYGKSKDRKTMRTYKINADGQKVRVAFMAGEAEAKVDEFAQPQPDRPCPKCNGSARGCPECEGCGRVTDRIETLRLERRISEFLLKDFGTRAARRNKA